MRMSPVLLAAFVAFVAQAAEVCELPRLHETSALATAAAQDQVLGQAFQTAAQACGARAEGCERARLECAGLLAAVIQKQRGLDEGMWLRDMLLPYRGQQYPMTRAFGAFAVATEASCNVEVSSLSAAGQRRLAQASRREAMVAEYALYWRWAEASLRECQGRAGASGATSPGASLDGGPPAASTLVVSPEELRRRAEEAARADARRAQEAAALQAKEELRRRDEAAAQARKDRLELEARARDEREANLERERRAEEERALAQRGQSVTMARAERARLLAEAELAYQQAVAHEEAKRQAAVEAVSVNPAVAQGAVAEAAHASRAREEAERGLAVAKLKAEQIVIDDSFERSRGHVGVLGGGGAMGWRDASGIGYLGPSIGALATAHVGFWAPAPLSGLAAGFELALGVRVLKPFAEGATPLELEGHLTGRYFFGALGLGAAGEFRLTDVAFGIRPFGVGLAAAVAVVDTPHVRVLLGVNWLPVGTAVDLARVTGDLEVSWEWFTFRLAAGSSTQVLAASTPVGWQAMAFAGARLGW